MKALDLKTENTILKKLLKDGEFYINYWGTDCDGFWLNRLCEFG